MGLITATAADLRHLVHVRPKVMAMAAPEASAAGARLRPVFDQFATNRAYAGITFVWLSAADTALTGSGLTAPSFYTFAQGQLVYGDTLSTEQQVRGVLHALYARA